MPFLYVDRFTVQQFSYIQYGLIEKNNYNTLSVEL